MKNMLRMGLYAVSVLAGIDLLITGLYDFFAWMYPETFKSPYFATIGPLGAVVTLHAILLIIWPIYHARTRTK